MRASSAASRALGESLFWRDRLAKTGRYLSPGNRRVFFSRRMSSLLAASIFLSCSASFRSRAVVSSGVSKGVGKVIWRRNARKGQRPKSVCLVSETCELPGEMFGIGGRISYRPATLAGHVLGGRLSRLCSRPLEVDPEWVSVGVRRGGPARGHHGSVRRL
jgi:hypothetical protein